MFMLQEKLQKSFDENKGKYQIKEDFKNSQRN